MFYGAGMSPSQSHARIEPATDSTIAQAGDMLRHGHLVAFPTETVYGLGADAFNPRAVCRIFEVKKRPRFDPLIVHVSAPAEAEPLWARVPRAALRLIEEFWPGPLTIVLPKRRRVLDIVTAGLDTVAVRMPDHEAALGLIRRLGRPIAAPSANLFGRVSPSSARAVWEDLGGSVDLILDGGSSAVGIESTVVKVEGGGCVLLRPGAVPVERIEEILPVRRLKKAPFARESPGLTESHYAPRTPLRLITVPSLRFAKDLRRFRELHRRNRIPWPRIGALVYRRKIPSGLIARTAVLSRRGDLVEAASNLFQAIRKLDKMNLDVIVAESVPERAIGLAIMDRLKRASGGLGFAGIHRERKRKSD